MPFINGKFYANPAYGRAVEAARSAEADNQDSESNHQGGGSHWVTISGKHVLIGARSRIAATARKYSGSADWAYARQKDNFPPSTNKCNKFVYDATKEAGAAAAVKGSDGKLRSRANGPIQTPRLPIGEC